MKRKLLILAGPAAIAAILLAGCSTERITARTDPGRDSIVLVSQGYDTVGRKWETPEPKPVAQPAAQTAAYTPVYSPWPPAEPKTLTRSQTEIHTYSGTITAIDYSTREITLKTAQGETETFKVSQDVQRFNEAKVGDKVSATYYYGFNAEVRKPTAEEQANPVVYLQATGRAGPGEDPARAGAQQLRAVVTIEGLDRANQTITVKGPLGKYYVAKVIDPSRFDDVRIGDTIVMTFTEALAISLDKAE